MTKIDIVFNSHLTPYLNLIAKRTNIIMNQKGGNIVSVKENLIISGATWRRGVEQEVNFSYIIINGIMMRAECSGLVFYIPPLNRLYKVIILRYHNTSPLSS